MAITLRTEEGGPLSWEQVDSNFSSLVYTGSMSGSNLVLEYYQGGQFTRGNLVLPIVSSSYALRATSAATVTITNITSSFGGPWYPTFVVGNNGNIGINVDSDLYYYTPTTNTLTVTSSYATQALSASYAVTSSMTTAISGSSKYIPVFTEARTLVNSMIFSDGNNVGINTATPDPSAILDLDSDRKGFLPPRMTTSDMNAINSPMEGLIVYDKDIRKVAVYDGTSWKYLSFA